MKLIRNYLLYTFSGLLLVLSIVGLFTQGFSIVIYSIGGGVVLYYLNKVLHNLEEEEKLQLDRISWFFGRVADLDPAIQYNVHQIQQFTSQNSELAALTTTTELGLQEFRLPSKRELPDISRAEVEMSKLEERSSIILGSLVFIPVLFALIHLFRSVTLVEFLIELISAIALGILVLETQGEKYSLKDWDKAYSFLFQHRDELEINPRKFMTTAQFGRTNYRIQELGINPDYDIIIPANSFVNLVVQFLIELQPNLRKQYIDNILVSIDNLPGKQVVMEEKWKTYSTRLIMIAVSSTALGALFASLTAFRIPLLSAPGYELETTEFLGWGQFVLLMVLNGIVLMKWFDIRKTARWLIILGFVYLTFFWINNLII